MKKIILFIIIFFSFFSAFGQEKYKHYYYHNGNIKSEGQYDNNSRRTGEWKDYYESGKLWEIQNYEDGNQ